MIPDSKLYEQVKELEAERARLERVIRDHFSPSQAEAILGAQAKVERDDHSGRWYAVNAAGERVHGPYQERPSWIA